MPHARATLPGAAGSNSSVDLLTDNQGRTVLAPQMRDETSSGVTDALVMNPTDETTLIAAPGADVLLCLSSFHVAVTGLVNPVIIQLLDGSGGAVVWAMQFAVAGRLRIAVEFPSTICLSANTAAVMKLGGLTGATVYATLVAQKVR